MVHGIIRNINPCCYRYLRNLTLKNQEYEKENDKLMQEIEDMRLSFDNKVTHLQEANSGLKKELRRLWSEAKIKDSFIMECESTVKRLEADNLRLKSKNEKLHGMIRTLSRNETVVKKTEPKLLPRRNSNSKIKGEAQSTKTDYNDHIHEKLSKYLVEELQKIIYH